LTYQWQFDGTNLPLIISTVAGNGTNGEAGDGGRATNAELYAGAVGVDTLGDFFIADSANERVRETNPGGIIDTVAGDGTNGFAGDGLIATNASLFNPVAVAADSAGNLYIADEANNRIRIVGSNGVISTFAGNGNDSFSGDGESATNASLASPAGLAVDGQGNLYIADHDNSRIRQVGTNGIISTIAGNGTNGFSGDGGTATNASLSNPLGVAVDGMGNIFIADSGNKRIRKVGLNGIIITVAGNGDAGYYGDGGPATSAFMESPAGVAVDAVGNIYIADGTEHIREVGLNGIISTVAGNKGLGFAGDGGPPTNSMLGEVYGLATDVFGELYMADTGNNRIRKISAFGPSLPLNNFNFTETGTYQLIVSSPFGSVTSAVVVVTAELAPLSVALSGSNGVTIQFSGTPGSNYVLQATTNLAPPPTWQAVDTNVAGLNGSGFFVETNLPVSAAIFYRLAVP
jgi:sugar lactone lactonase YvrE